MDGARIAVTGGGNFPRKGVVEGAQWYVVTRMKNTLLHE